MPRPGMFPPTLKGSAVFDHVVPALVLRSIAPFDGSLKTLIKPTDYVYFAAAYQLFVYAPTAAYTFCELLGSVATASIPQLFLG